MPSLFHAILLKLMELKPRIDLILPDQELESVPIFKVLPLTSPPPIEGPPANVLIALLTPPMSDAFAKSALPLMVIILFFTLPPLEDPPVMSPEKVPPVIVTLFPSALPPSEHPPTISPEKVPPVIVTLLPSALLPSEHSPSI